MGLFFNNYNKEGPGVKKNERKKKGFFAFFEIYFRNFWKLFVVSFVYSAVSVIGLGFTNGLAKAGMTHVVRSMGREKHSFLLSDFFETIKKNWKQCLVLGILNMISLALLGLDIWYFWGQVSNAKDLAIGQIIGLGVSLAILIVVTYIKYYIWTMAITFSLSIKQLLKNGFHFCFINISKNLLMSVILGLLYLAVFVLAYMGPGLMVLAIIIAFCVIPGFKMSIVQAMTFPSIKKYIIDPYYAEHKGEDIEKRRALGLEISEDELENEKQQEILFTDTVSEKED